MKLLLGAIILFSAILLPFAGSAQAGDSISIILAYMDGKKITLSVEPDASVSDVKELASEQDKVPAEKHRLIYRGSKLEDDKTLADYGIQDGAELHVLFRL